MLSRFFEVCQVCNQIHSKTQKFIFINQIPQKVDNYEFTASLHFQFLDWKYFWTQLWFFCELNHYSSFLTCKEWTQLQMCTPKHWTFYLNRMRSSAVTGRSTECKVILSVKSETGHSYTLNERKKSTRTHGKVLIDFLILI